MYYMPFNLLILELARVLWQNEPGQIIFRHETSWKISWIYFLKNNFEKLYGMIIVSRILFFASKAAFYYTFIVGMYWLRQKLRGLDGQAHNRDQWILTEREVAWISLGSRGFPFFKIFSGSITFRISISPRYGREVLKKERSVRVKESFTRILIASPTL